MISLRDYQKDLVTAVRNECIAGHKRILMVLPTGGGKTYICADISSRTAGKDGRVLCLMHRRQLVGQMADKFADYGLDTGIIMAGIEPDLDAKIQIGTIQTYSRRLKIDDDGHHPFFVDADVIIIDEAHRSLSQTYQKVLGLYADKIVTGVTATPCLSSGVGMGKYYQALVDKVSVKELQKTGDLVQFIYYAPTKPDLKKIKTIAGDYDTKGLEKVMNKQKLVGDVFLNWSKIAGGMQTIVFAVNVKHSMALRDEFVRNGIAAEHLDARSDEETRESVLARLFSGDIQVVTNVGLYVEGFDYPAVECIVLARPTKSMGLYRQMAGRGGRPAPGKKSVIIIDHGGCVDRLGFIEDDVVWTLDGKKIACTKRVVRKKEAHIMTCDMCDFMFSGKRCPQCGTEVESYGKKIEALDAELVNVCGKKEKHTIEEKYRFFGMLEHERRVRGYKPGWVANQYKRKFSVWPKNVDKLGPIPPDQAFLSWMQHLRIKWAKSKRAAERRL